MAYDTALADEIRAVLGDEPGLTEKAMFGGLGFLVHGHMAVAASGHGGLLVRAGREREAELLREDGVEPMVMQGRSTAGWLHVTGPAIAAEGDVARWVAIGLGVARGLPPKG